MIHANRLVRDKLRFDIWGYITRQNPNYNLILAILIYSMLTLVVSIVLAIIYDKIFSSVVRKIFESMYNTVCIFYKKLENKILRLK